ncbi:MAG: FecR domain-containing protein [Isosphaeraceae bacterium]|nr:FecR domain-containing protein [Isosphaeraceae bacterium]
MIVDPVSLIHGYLDDLLSDEQVRELNQWIKEDPDHARQFAAIALLHDRLHGHAQASSELMGERLGAGVQNFQDYCGGGDSWWRPVAVLRGRDGRLGLDRGRDDRQTAGWGGSGRRRWSLVAVMLIGVGLAALAIRGARHVSSGVEVATLVESHNVVWSQGQVPIAMNMRIGAREIRCQSGTLKLAFDSGAVVSLEGPADLRVLSGMLIRVVRGRISARVEDGIKGFAIETPNALVVDQGTEFGVEVDAVGQTDVVVFEGLVDLSCPEVGAQPVAVKRLKQGEAMRVGKAGNLSRIVSVDRGPVGDGWSTRPSTERNAVIRSVRDNIRGLGSSKYYEIVHYGLDEDKPAFVDRIHEWNGLDANGLPGFLRGADYIMTFCDDKWREGLEITVEVGRAATLYIFFDDRLTIPSWLSEQFVNSGVKIGLDEGGTMPNRRVDWVVAKGPGQSIDNTFSVWKRELGRGESIQLGALANAAEKDRWTAMYGIAAVARP